MNKHKILLIGKLGLGSAVACVVGVVLLMPTRRPVIFTPNAAVGDYDGGAAQRAIGSRGSFDDHTVILERNIFGAAGSSSAWDRSNSDSVWAGRFPSAGQELGLELVGTIAGSPAVSRAVIKDTKENVLGLYRTGHIVAGASIESIAKDAVILLHNGRKKMLSLKAADTCTLNAAKPSASRTIENANVSGAGGRAVSVEQATGYAPATNSTSIGYIEAILTKAVIRPYTVNGQVEGLKITGLESVPAAKALGLKDGDVVRQVNGQRLTSLQKAFQVFQKAKSQPAIRLELLRGEDTKEIKFDLR